MEESWLGSTSCTGRWAFAVSLAVISAAMPEVPEAFVCDISVSILVSNYNHIGITV